MAPDETSIEPTIDEAGDLFDMANLYPRTTGLPVTVWVSPRGGARHDVRVKAAQTPGDRTELTDVATVAVRPQPRVINGQLSAEIQHAVLAWTAANTNVLVDYWNGRLDTIELGARLIRF
ncbi:MAG: hypothetical protein ACYDD1_11400 [Caulobacteraceae bacterium]